MPTYEYACRECGEHLEVVQSFRDDPLTVCPSCSGELRKVFSAAGLIFKGSGWHIKDYGTSTRRAPASAESDASADGPAHSDSGSKTTTGTEDKGKATADESSTGKVDSDKRSA